MITLQKVPFEQIEYIERHFTMAAIPRDAETLTVNRCRM